METNETGENLSTQKVLSSNHDAGWNDPPKWAVSGGQSCSSTPTKRLLNKRVAFPLTSSQTPNKEQSSDTSPRPVNMPPPLESSIHLTTAPHRPMMLPTDTSISKSETDLDKSKVLEDTLRNFRAVIDENVTNKAKAEEITKRLDLMKACWLEDKLNSSIHAKVLDLSKALHEKDVDKADKIHIALMLQYASLCSPWIPGIRHIILELKTKLPDAKQTEVQTTQLCLLPVDAKELN